LIHENGISRRGSKEVLPFLATKPAAEPVLAHPLGLSAALKKEGVQLVLGLPPPPRTRMVWRVPCGSILASRRTCGGGPGGAALELPGTMDKPRLGSEVSARPEGDRPPAAGERAA
jgi:hypothetical protein